MGYVRCHGISGKGRASARRCSSQSDYWIAYFPKGEQEKRTYKASCHYHMHTLMKRLRKEHGPQWFLLLPLGDEVEL
jgi:hypothetical protein